MDKRVKDQRANVTKMVKRTKGQAGHRTRGKWDEWGQGPSHKAQRAKSQGPKGTKGKAKRAKGTEQRANIKWVMSADG